MKNSSNWLVQLLRPTRAGLILGLFAGLGSAAFGAAPVITSVSPTEGPAGTRVTISGADLSGTTSVRFNTAEASFTLFGNSLFATVPADATTGPITVTTPSGSATSSTVFTVTSANEPAAPTISGFSPATGAPGNQVTISGSNLSGVTSVKFNGVEASFSLFAPNIVATIPATATTGPISVTSPSGTATSADPFVISFGPAPVLTGFSPVSGPVGTQVAISGTDLKSATEVRFTGGSAKFSIFGDQILAEVPVGASNGPITVVTPGGSSTSGKSFAVTQELPLAITGFEPARGAEGDEITINGAGFKDVTSVEFNGVPAEFSTFTGQLVAIVPTNAPSGPITVRTATDVATSSTNFLVIRFPQIESFVPAQGPSGTPVTITGENLDSVTAVLFGELNAEFSFNGSNIVATVPPAAVTGFVSVTNVLGTASSTNNFIVGSGTSLSVRLSSTQAELEVGDTAQYIAAVLNSGPLTASNTVLQVTLPAALEFVSANSTAGDVVKTTNGFSVRAGALADGETFALFGVVRAAASGTVKISAALTNDVPELNSADDSAELTFHVSGGTSTPPTLQIQTAGPAQVQLSWPDSGGGFSLQSAVALNAPISWESVTNAPTSAGGSNTLKLMIQGNARFFRLAH